MRYGVDMTLPPTIAQAQQMASLGWTWCGVYVGGPRAAAHTAWHQQDGVSYPVRDIVPYFTDGFLPICVGRNVPWDQAYAYTWNKGVQDGSQANVDTGACGFDASSPMVLDVEYGTWEKYGTKVINYIAGFASVVNGAGHRLYVYGDQALANFLHGHPELVDGVWAADPVWQAPADTAAPVGSFDPSIPPYWDAWQFGNGSLSGVAVDFDSCVDSFELAKYAL